MKKTAVCLVVLILASAIAGVSAFATGPAYRGADGDGICDNCGSAAGRCFTDTDGDGICDNCDLGSGRQNRHGRNR